MPIPILSKLFSGGAEKLIATVGNVIDNIGTSREEKDAAKLALEQEINRHMEQLEANTLKEMELENQDRSSARTRETEFVKATGHQDYMMWVLAISAIVIFTGIVWHLIKEEVPSENRELLTNIVGIIEGVLISIYSYYWGSSAGSRIKDMRPK